MWNVGIGVIELLFCLILMAAVVWFRGSVRRWLGVALATTVLAIVLTPSDPISMVLAALMVGLTFTVGVYAAPYFRHRGDVDNTLTF